MSTVIVKSPYLKTGAGAGGYLRYIATREGAEPVTGYLQYITDRPRSHGLFGDADDIDLAKAAGELEACRARVWTHIFSLKREDASRLGYDNADAWQNLLRAHRNEIAAAMHIRPNDFHWYAAFHNEGEHPHVHMMAWSASKHWFSLATEQDDGLAQYALGKLDLSDNAEVRDIEAGLYWLQRAAANGSEWANYRLGKEYLHGELIPQNKQMAEAYLTAVAEKGTVCAQYALGKLYFSDGDKARAAYWLSCSAANGSVYAQFLLDRIDSPRPPDVLFSATRLLSALAQIFRDNSTPPANPSGLRMDSKRRQKFRQKRTALGHKADDHEDYVDPKLTM